MATSSIPIEDCFYQLASAGAVFLKNVEISKFLQDEREVKYFLKDYEEILIFLRRVCNNIDETGHGEAVSLLSTKFLIQFFWVKCLQHLHPKFFSFIQSST